jgi:hypothetical protein
MLVDGDMAGLGLRSGPYPNAGVRVFVGSSRIGSDLPFAPPMPTSRVAFAGRSGDEALEEDKCFFPVSSLFGFSRLHPSTLFLLVFLICLFITPVLRLVLMASSTAVPVRRWPGPALVQNYHPSPSPSEVEDPTKWEPSPACLFPASVCRPSFQKILRARVTGDSTEMGGFPGFLLPFPLCYSCSRWKPHGHARSTFTPCLTP